MVGLYKEPACNSFLPHPPASSASVHLILQVNCVIFLVLIQHVRLKDPVTMMVSLVTCLVDAIAHNLGLVLNAVNTIIVTLLPKPMVVWLASVA